MSQIPAAPPGAVSAVSVSSVSSAAAVATALRHAGRAPVRQSREALRAFLRNPSPSSACCCWPPCWR